MNLDLIGRGQHGFSFVPLQAIHRYIQPLLIHLDQKVKVVVVNFLALKWVVRSALDGIGMGASTSGAKIGDATVLVALVVGHMAGKPAQTRPGVGLSTLEHLG